MSGGGPSAVSEDGLSAVSGGGPSAVSGGGVRPPTVPAAEANRSSRESGAAVWPVSPVESSYSRPHQSSS
ncbi:hypothetical protein B1H29_07620 [Streptomyces pactum]|uniref:Uncharacterized protein n=1 Tax=Streptomyces pactum TaxID=68249 RepID=A0A1S6J4Y7_9ACTN|nr:hypothetical protein B1H29_07620 [Streptomyces pactum]